MEKDEEKRRARRIEYEYYSPVVEMVREAINEENGQSILCLIFFDGVEMGSGTLLSPNRVFKNNEGTETRFNNIEELVSVLKTMVREVKRIDSEGGFSACYSGWLRKGILQHAALALYIPDTSGQDEIPRGKIFDPKTEKEQSFRSEKGLEKKLMEAAKRAFRGDKKKT